MKQESHHFIKIWTAQQLEPAVTASPPECTILFPTDMARDSRVHIQNHCQAQRAPRGPTRAATSEVSRNNKIIAWDAPRLSGMSMTVPSSHTMLCVVTEGTTSSLLKQNDHNHDTRKHLLLCSSTKPKSYAGICSFPGPTAWLSFTCCQFPSNPSSPHL